MEILSITAGFWFYRILRRKSNDTISDHHRLIILAGAAAGALAGSRLLAIAEDPFLFLRAESKFIFFFGNKTIIGGMLGGLVAVEVTKKLIGVKQSSGDLMTFPIILAMIIGRFGCFAEGLLENTFGKPTGLFTGVDFGDGIRRHPLQLYEIACLVLLWIFLVIMEKRVILKDGARFKIFMAVYVLQRFLFEFLKPNTFLLCGLSSIQVACLAGMIYYWKVFLWPSSLSEKRKLMAVKNNRI